MADRRLRALLVALALALALAAVVAVFVAQSSLVYYLVQPDPEYERTTVTTYDADGTELAAVDVRIADTRAKRWLGLSATDDLPAGEGMLFVHDAEREHTYVMRNMSFGLDIVFVGADERVTTVHHAPAPDDGADGSYAGRAKWVLEVPLGWTNETGLDPGDRVAIPRANVYGM